MTTSERSAKHAGGHVESLVGRWERKRQTRVSLAKASEWGESPREFMLEDASRLACDAVGVGWPASGNRDVASLQLNHVVQRGASWAEVCREGGEPPRDSISTENATAQRPVEPIRHSSLAAHEGVERRE